MDGGGQGHQQHNQGSRQPHYDGSAGKSKASRSNDKSPVLMLLPAISLLLLLTGAATVFVLGVEATNSLSIGAAGGHPWLRPWRTPLEYADATEQQQRQQQKQQQQQQQQQQHEQELQRQEQQVQIQHKGQHLHGQPLSDVCGVTSFFNPAGFASKAGNFNRFSKRVRRQGLFLILVELAYDDRPFALGDSPEAADQVIRLRVPAVRGVLWQKERLLNIGIERAAPHCKKIVWADLDIDFLSDTWVNDLSAALDDHDVVQPFAWAYRMMSHEEDQARERQAAHQHSQFLRSAGAAAAVAAAASGPALSQVDVLTKMPTGASDGQILHSAGFGLSVLRNMNRSDEGVDARLRGHSGYACAARRDFLSRVGGLYDKMITGGGDDIMAKAWQNMGVVGQAHDKYPAALQRNASAWIAQVGAQTQGMVGFLRGVILHHYHGSQANRHYSMRMRILHDNQFDPATDIKKDPATGVWVWRNDPAIDPDWERVDKMRVSTLEYFQSRKEDQAMPPNQRMSCLAVEDRVEVCQWLEQLRSLYLDMEPLPAGVTVSPSLTDGLSPPEGCFRPDTMCVGTDLLRYVNVNSVVQCWHLCKAESRHGESAACECFTFRPSDGNCFLKHNVSGWKPHSGRTSGPIDCAGVSSLSQSNL